MVRKRKQHNIYFQILEIFILALVVALVIRTFMVQGFIVAKDTMEETLLGGDVLLGEKLSIRETPPKLGEILIFRYPLNPRKYFLGRCVALAGQEVEIVDKGLYIDGEPANEPPGVQFIDQQVFDMLFSNRDNFGPFLVPPASIFVLGDNRDLAIDSRFWGEVPLEFVRARPLFVYWSVENMVNITNHLSFLSRIGYFFKSVFTYPARLRLGRIGKLAR